MRDRLKVAQFRQKSYANTKRKEVAYEVGEREREHIFVCPQFEELNILESRGS